MGCLPYFKFYPSDWTIGTLSLTLAERGAYIGLLAWSWENGPLPGTDAERARVLGVNPEELRKLWPALERFWREGPNGWTNKRLEDERKGAQQRSRKAKASALQRHHGERT